MLKVAQIECIKLLVKGITITDIAEELNVSRGTIYSWKEIPEFKAELDKLEQEYLNAASNSLKYAAPVAAKKVLDLMKHSGYDKIQLDAAINVLDRTTGKATTKVEINKNDNKENVSNDILEDAFSEVDKDDNEEK